MEYNKQIAYMVPGDEVEGYYLLNSAAQRLSSNGKAYLTGSLRDVSGSMDYKVWDYQGQLDGDCDGKIVKIRGTVSEYKGARQLTVSRIRTVTDADTRNYNIEDIIPSAPIDSVKELEYIQNLVASIEDQDYRRVSEAMLDRHLVSFGKIPAAKSIHHSFISGLLMHTGNMLRIADFLSTNIYPDAVDRSLLLAGTLLHDFAKDREFSFSELGTVTDMSTKGRLLGHLVMGAEEVGSLCRDLNIPEEKTMLLQHMILSHHGQPEYGAAVVPCIAESELLYHIDLIDSRMEIYAETFEQLPSGSFSDKIFALDKRIYNHD